MSRREMTGRLDAAGRWGPRVNKAALPFEKRWTRRALKLHDPKLAEQFEVQLERYCSAIVSGTSTEIDTEGARMCQAYALVAAELHAANVPDDAYLIGRDAKSGLTIAISPVPAAAERVREVYGDGVIWFSPDEIATLVELHERAKHSK